MRNIPDAKYLYPNNKKKKYRGTGTVGILDTTFIGDEKPFHEQIIFKFLDKFIENCRNSHIKYL